MRALDQIAWAPLGVRITRSEEWLHNCPTAVISVLVSREELDPLALGVCRYCKERLPTGDATERARDRQ